MIYSFCTKSLSFPLENTLKIIYRTTDYYENNENNENNGIE